MRLNELEPGNKVVIDDGFNHLSIGTVTKVTKTQITITRGSGVEVRYNRSDGVKIGDANAWRKEYILRKEWGEVLTPEEAAGRIAEQRERRVKAEMIDKIKNTQSAIYQRMPIGTLEAIVAMIDAAKVEQ